MDPRLAFDTLDVTSNDANVDGPPHDMYTLLRAEAPVTKHRGMEPGAPEWFWAVSKHADVVEISRQYQTYSSAAKGALMNQDRPDLELARMIIDMDPPEHTRLRNLVNRGFIPKAIRMLESRFREVAAGLVSEALAEGEVDFVDKVSAELPLVAIAQLLGVPHEDRRKVFEWSNRMIGAMDSEYGGGMDDAANASMELYMYANELAAKKRANPGDDIISVLISAEGDDRLTEHEFDLFVLLLSVAGNETTRNGISHGLLALIEHPEAWAQLKADPSLVNSAIEEILRWGTPVNHFVRTALADVELRGVKISKGDAVCMLYASANRDEDVFTDPFTFDITRNPNPHVTFGGGGPHFCLGFNLAKMEMRVLFEELIRQVGTIEMVGQADKLQSNFIHGIKHLNVKLTADA